MTTDIQFRGSKVVVINQVPEWKLKRARRLITQALNGQVKFAWQRFRPAPKVMTLPDRLLQYVNWEGELPEGDYNINDHSHLTDGDRALVLAYRRARKYNENTNYDVQHDATGLRDWRKNLNQLREALKLLFTNGEVAMYHVDGTGKLSVEYMSGEKYKIDNDKVRPRRSGARHPNHTPKTSSKSVPVAVGVHERIATLESELKKLREENKIKAVEEYGKSMDVIPHQKNSNIKYKAMGIQNKREPKQNMLENVYTYHPRSDDAWSKLCDQWHDLNADRNKMFARLYEVYTHYVKTSRREMIERYKEADRMKETTRCLSAVVVTDA